MPKAQLSIFILFFCPYLIIASPNLHLITFAASGSPDIGAGCSINAKRMQQNAKAMADALDYNFQLHLYEGDSFSVETYKQMLHSIETNIDDAIIFYFSGHGHTRVISQNWPSIYLSNEPNPSWATMDQRSVPLDEIYSSLNNLPHSSLIVIGESCSVSIEEPPTNYAAAFHILSFNTEDIQGLFSEKPHWIVSSCSVFQVSYINNETGGVFSLILDKVLGRVAQRQLECSWESILSNTQTLVLALTENKQKVFFEKK